MEGGNDTVSVFVGGGRTKVDWGWWNASARRKWDREEANQLGGRTGAWWIRKPLDYKQKNRYMSTRSIPHVCARSDFPRYTSGGLGFRCWLEDALSSFPADWDREGGQWDQRQLTCWYPTRLRWGGVQSCLREDWKEWGNRSCWSSGIGPAIRYHMTWDRKTCSPYDAQAKPRLVRTSLFGGSTLRIQFS